jgi:FdrA protein
MYTGIKVRKNQYYDSVFLMGINNRLLKVDGVKQIAVLMGSDANKDVLIDLGFKSVEIQFATANDLIVAVSADTQSALEAVLDHLDEWLTSVNHNKISSDVHTLEQALKAKPEANLVVISVPGEFAANETKKSIEAGKNVFLFSDNVKIEDEVSLKKFARDKGLLIMGPDCGTSLIGGVGIGFANVVRRGKIGVIAAAGTGLQEFTCMIHNAGFGISQGIGTGGRDLSDAVGGITTLFALDTLENDPATEVITILSKPPGEKTLVHLVERIKTCRKPFICCFLGIKREIEGEGKYFKRAKIIDEAVQLAIQEVGRDITRRLKMSESEKPRRNQFQRFQKNKYLRGIFAGGTFCYQSQQILEETGINVFSNAPLENALKLDHPDQSRENTVIDMGDEYYMVGRPHPMIDGSQRALRIIKEANDPQVALLLIDFILGYNSSMDPVGELVEAIQEAKRIAQKRGETLEVVASICGTDGDPQDVALQTKMLIDCGVVVFTSNAQAAYYCSNYLREVNRV